MDYLNKETTILITTRIQLKSDERPYVFDPYSVIFIDTDGVLLNRGEYCVFVDGEYEPAMKILSDLGLHEVQIDVTPKTSPET